eukprot:CAMPEP_0182517180 /NCGR_PEP_ID=MMETSP1321-20130603/41753_1 /TAXON_ID=91990 /ORGANISM="Bolidomonas sp., Strain RCC1657" /LENGTH=757 /DNA_ID=CAMNT_0024724903 /DNA_START=55 /DNA_END=2328 /DNA_ORIENTATION=-
MPADEVDREDIKLQAVLLADSFTKTFRPASFDKPKVLCPLNNVAMLDYTIEWLASSGVEELFVFCVQHADQVKAYVESSSWTTAIKVTCVKDTTCTNPGDALRELDKRGLVRSDPFIMMSGDVVTNVDVREALKEHKKRHKADSANMMTVLMKEVPHNSPLRSVADDLIVGINSNSNQICMFESRKFKDSNVQIPSSFFDAQSNICVKSDLLDCGIDICSPDVLARFSDEFDYKDIRKQFIRNSVAEEEEGLQNKIFAHFLGSTEYAARVHDFRTYSAISKDLIRRWCYPVVPDNLPSGYERKFAYEYSRHFVYREVKGNTVIARSTQIKNGCILGANANIEEGGKVASSVIGNDCYFGKNVVIEGSHIWSNVKIGSNVKVDQSIICDGCEIKEGAVISKGCVIGSNCVIGKGIVLKPFSRITCSANTDEGDDGDDDWSDSEEDEDVQEDVGGGEFESEVDVVGEDGKGKLWHPIVTDEDGGSSEDEEEWGEGGGEDWDEFVSVESQSIGFDVKGANARKIKLQSGGDLDDSGGGSVGGGDEGEGEGEWGGSENDGDMFFEEAHVVGRQKGVDVVKELRDLCLEHDHNSSFQNLAIELNSFKFSQNATYEDVNCGAVLAVAERVKEGLGDEGLSSVAKVLSALKKELVLWTELFEKCTPRKADECGIIVGAERLVCLPGMEKFRAGGGFRFILQTLNDEDILSEEAIEVWKGRREKGEGGKDGLELFADQSLKDFLEWLEEESDESDGSEDEEEEED